MIKTEVKTAEMPRLRAQKVVTSLGDSGPCTAALTIERALQTVPLDEIRMDPELQSRVERDLDPAILEAYAERYAAGDELPSVREVAEQLAVNPMTVSKAYSLLEAAGILERRRGLGMIVAESHDKRRPLAERLEILRPTLKRAAEETAQLEIDPDIALQQFGKMLKGKG